MENTRTEILNRIDLARDYDEHHCSYREIAGIGGMFIGPLCTEAEWDPFSGRCQAHTGQGY